MSLPDSISALRQALQSETPTSTHLSELGSLWTEAHRQALRGKLLAIQQQAEAEIHAAAASAQAALLAQIQRAEEAARVAASASIAQTKVTEAVPATEAPIAPPKPIPAAQAPEPVAAPTSVEEAPVVEARPEAPIAAAVTPPVAAPVAAPASSASPSVAPGAGSAKSVNARYAGLKVGLNDRVAFVKHLFNGEDDDFQRVVAALATMESKEECETFLENAVYPDYDWTQKPEFAERFLALVFARFE
ncbi:MAG: hypothetical protein RL168_356 [Bacteroidota bacterium]